MPPSVANFLSAPANSSKNINLSLKSTSPTSSDPSAFPTALKRATRFEAQEPRDVRPVERGETSKVSKKSAKTQAAKKQEKSDDDVQRTAGPKSKRTKTATVDEAKHAEDSEAVDDDVNAKTADANTTKDAKPDPTDAAVALAQASAQAPPTAPVDAAEPDPDAKAEKSDADGNPIAVDTVDAAVTKAQAEPASDSTSKDHHDDDNGATDDAIAKALADHTSESTAPKQSTAAAKAPAHTDAEAAPELGATSTGETHSHAHPAHPAEKLDAAANAFSAMSSAADLSASTAGGVTDHASTSDDGDAATFDAMIASAGSGNHSDATPLKVDSTPAPAPAPRAPQERFALENHEKIVSSVKSELLPGGGTMKIKLDPPELGPMAVAVHMRDGVMTATFETSSDEAAKLLSHSLGQLKSSLEAQGISVEKLHVQQAPKSSESRGGGEDAQQNRDGQSPQQEASARQDQQRKDMLRKMWRKLSGFQDPLDVTG